MWHYRAFLVAMAMLIPTVPLAAREWVDNSGRYRVQGELVSVEGQLVTIAVESGRVRTVLLDKLSLADRIYVIVAQSVHLSPIDAGNDILPTDETVPADSNTANAGSEQDRARPEHRTRAVTAALVRQQEPPPAETGNGAARTWLFKRVYSGSRGTFHLIGRIGTAHYYLHSCHHHHHCCCCASTSYLASLSYINSDSNFHYYEASDGDPFTVRWAFGRRSKCGCLHEVWRETRSGWQEFGLFYVHIPR